MKKTESHKALLTKTKGYGALDECPVCNSREIFDDGYPETEGDYITRQISCDKCNTTWIEHYTPSDWELTHNGETGEDFQ